MLEKQISTYYNFLDGMDLKLEKLINLQIIPIIVP